MKTPHVHAALIKEWADDPSRVVQYLSDIDGEWKDCLYTPSWESCIEFRFKPEPKPDYVGYYHSAYLRRHARELQYGDDTLRLTFDGDTGTIKSAEVLK